MTMYTPRFDADAPRQRPDDRDGAQPLSHPASQVLEDFAGGQLHALQRILTEAHLAFCPACRRRVARLEAAGARYFAGLPRLDVPGDLWNRLEARLGTETSPSEPDPWADLPLPPGLLGELPRRTEPLHWLAPLGGLGEVTRLAHDDEEQLELLLVRTPPEEVFPFHRHLGGEELVVLAGGLSDQFGAMRLGDYRYYPPGSGHEPKMAPGEVCYAVTCLRGGASFQA